MSKLVPYWGQSPQPASTYYLQKLSHDIFGIVNHATNNSAVYLFDERVGPKNTDHTVSYLSHYISQLPDWMRRIHLFLDNTCSTNKHWYAMAWAMEMVQQGKLDFLRVSFLIAGHTKFSPDMTFAKIAKSYNRSDVFNTVLFRPMLTYSLIKGKLCMIGGKASPSIRNSQEFEASMILYSLKML